MPRRSDTARLEQRHALLTTDLKRTYNEAAQFRERRRALTHDPHYREFAVRWALRHRLPGEMTVEEYVRSRRRPAGAAAP